MCVEDHDDTCELIALVLADCQVISAKTKAEALQRATSEEFDLILLDYHLPNGNGLEVCQFIRTFDKKTPIIFSTGTNEITKADVARANAQGLIKKGPPFIDNLLAVATQYLR